MELMAYYQHFKSIQMKGILIDAKNKQVIPVKIAGDLASMYLTLGVSMVEIGWTDQRTGETLWVDEEGKINGTDYGFIIAGGLRIVGNGLILGSDMYGENADTKVAIENLDVTFIEVNPEEEQRNIDIQVHFN
jgi:hypothetical protein